MKAIYSLAFAGALLLAGCETTSSLPYQSAATNAIAAQSALRPINGKASVGPFSLSNTVESPTCRAMGALDVSAGKDIASYIHDALQTELFAAGVYDATAPQITGSIDALEMNSFGTGSWTIAVTVKSAADPTGYQVSSTHSFKTSFSAMSACQNAATAFNPAVQKLLHAIITHPGFPRLVASQR